MGITATQTVTKTYFFAGQPIAQKVGGRPLTYLHADHLGSTVLTTGVSGSQKYHAYGALRAGGVQSDYQFTGQEADSGTGLIYMQARYYDPVIGQFISPDTIVPDPNNLYAYNRYMYGYGNPLKLSDPSGHCATLEDGSPNTEGEENYACWQQAYTIYGAGFSPYTTFEQDWKVTPDFWLKNIASAFYADAEYLRPFAQTYTEQHLYGSGAQQHPVKLHEPPPVPSIEDRLEIVRLFEGAGVCEVWDCMSIGLDAGSVVVQVGRDWGLFSIPVGGPLAVAGATSGQIAANTLSTVSLAWTSRQYSRGEASQADLVVAVGGAAAPIITRSPIVGEFVSGFQLMWDLADPLLPW